MDLELIRKRQIIFISLFISFNRQFLFKEQYKIISDMVQEKLFTRKCEYCRHFFI